MIFLIDYYQISDIHAQADTSKHTDKRQQNRPNPDPCSGQRGGRLWTSAPGFRAKGNRNEKRKNKKKKKNTSKNKNRQKNKKRKNRKKNEKDTKENKKPRKTNASANRKKKSGTAPDKPFWTPVQRGL